MCRFLVLVMMKIEQVNKKRLVEYPQVRLLLVIVMFPFYYTVFLFRLFIWNLTPAMSLSKSVIIKSHLHEHCT
jgi:hypothetical protein